MEAPGDVATNRDDAWKFLEGLEAHLNKKIRPVEVRQWVQEAKRSNPDGKDVAYESPFLDKFVFSEISEYLRQTLAPADAVKAFLTESTFARKCGIASGTPASAQKHLFTKVLGVPAKALVDLWWGSGKTQPVRQSCPDWAFRYPCQHTVVFEGKLFRKGGVDAARTELVKAIYQCFYYRGQPRVPTTERHTGWDYDYACLVAYDASENDSLVRAWESVDPRVEKECWNASSIFVMVLPATP